MESPVTTILELHVSGLRERRTADLPASADQTRYRPVGGSTSTSATLWPYRAFSTQLS
jgi:hypothetical protein